MALYKIQENPMGVELTYHRVSSISSSINNSITIEVQSYISENKRQEELRWFEESEYRTLLVNKDPLDLTQEEQILLQTNQQPMNVYIYSQIYVLDYKPNFNVDDAYAYLKTLPEFEGALDV